MVGRLVALVSKDCALDRVAAWAMPWWRHSEKEMAHW